MHDRISPDPDFRHPSGPPAARSDRQFSSPERIYRRQASRSRRQQRRPRLRRPDQPRRSGIRAGRCTRRCRCPAAICPAITTSATTRPRSVRRRRSPPPNRDRQAFISVFGEDRWRFEAAGWCFIGLNSLVMNTGLAERGRTVRLACLAARRCRRQAGRAVPAQAAVLECARRSRACGLCDPLRADAGAKPPGGDAGIGRPAAGRQRPCSPAPGFTHSRVRHVWAPSAGFVISDQRQEVIGIKEVGLVEYRFQPDSFEVLHVRAPGQIDVDLDFAARLRLRARVSVDLVVA